MAVESTRTGWGFRLLALSVGLASSLGQAPVWASTTPSYGFDRSGGDYESDVYPPVEEEGSRRPSDGGGGNRWVIPAIVVGVAALAALHSMNTRAAEEPEAPSETDELSPQEREIMDQVLRDGPKFPPRYNTSAFAVIGGARAGWPVVLDFEWQGPGYIWLRVRGRGTDLYTYALHPLGAGRKLVQLQLPEELGETLRPILVTVMATEDAKATVPLPDFRLYALGCGPQAVGSVTINQLQFGPADIAVAREEEARYRFRTSSAFDRVAVEFVRVPDSRDGEHQELVGSALLPTGTRPGDVIGRDPPRTWDGRNQQREVSAGDHRLRVRGWRTSGDWVGALSDSTVRVLN